MAVYVPTPKPKAKAIGKKKNRNKNDSTKGPTDRVAFKELAHGLENTEHHTGDHLQKKPKVIDLSFSEFQALRSVMRHTKW